MTMTNTGQACDKRMLMQRPDQSTKGGVINFVPLNHRPLNIFKAQYENDPTKNESREIPESQLHDEDLYTYKFLRGAKFENSQQAVSHV